MKRVPAYMEDREYQHQRYPKGNRIARKITSATSSFRIARKRRLTLSATKTGKLKRKLCHKLFKMQMKYSRDIK